eukprot:scaffold2679_cov251-Pinguiococcus_pyrenoidosus.AAC.26
MSLSNVSLSTPRSLFAMLPPVPWWTSRGFRMNRQSRPSSPVVHSGHSLCKRLLDGTAFAHASIGRTRRRLTASSVDPPWSARSGEGGARGLAMALVRAPASFAAEPR